LTNIKQACHNSHLRTVRTETKLQAGQSGVRIPAQARDFSLLQNVQTGYGPHPASYLMFPGINWSEREADHSPQSNAEVKK